MKRALIEMLSSKKAIATLVTAICALAARHGFDADPEMVGLIVGLGATYVVAQGAADHGKEKARIESEKP